LSLPQESIQLLTSATVIVKTRLNSALYSCGVTLSLPQNNNLPHLFKQEVSLGWQSQEAATKAVWAPMAIAANPTKENFIFLIRDNRVDCYNKQK
jgi:hypothetical protein